eukprot:scaffold1293_cov375-Prasinococcus_capsulatus_cf.AAC.11
MSSGQHIPSGEPLTQGDKRRIASALWPEVQAFTSYAALHSFQSIAQMPKPRSIRQVAKKLEVSRNKVLRVIQQVSRNSENPGSILEYMMTDNVILKPPLPLKFALLDVHIQEFIAEALAAQRNGAAFEQAQVDTFIRTSLRTSSLVADDPSPATMCRLRKFLKEATRAEEHKASLYDRCRLDVPYQTCVEFVQELQSLADTFPEIRYNPAYWGNYDEQGSHGSAEKFCKPRVWLLPVDDEGNYSRQGKVPWRQYGHRSSASGQSFTHAPLVNAQGDLLFLAYVHKVANQKSCYIQPDWLAGPISPLIDVKSAQKRYLIPTNSGSMDAEAFKEMFIRKRGGLIETLLRRMTELGNPVTDKSPFVLTMDMCSVHAKYFNEIRVACMERNIILVRVPSNSTVDSNMLDNGVFKEVKKHRAQIMRAVSNCEHFSGRCIDPMSFEVIPCGDHARATGAARVLGLDRSLTTRNQILIHEMIWEHMVRTGRLQKLCQQAAITCAVYPPQLNKLQNWKCVQHHFQKERKGPTVASENVEEAQETPPLKKARKITRAAHNKQVHLNKELMLRSAAGIVVAGQQAIASGTQEDLGRWMKAHGGPAREQMKLKGYLSPVVPPSVMQGRTTTSQETTTRNQTQKCKRQVSFNVATRKGVGALGVCEGEKLHTIEEVMLEQEIGASNERNVTMMPEARAECPKEAGAVHLAEQPRAQHTPSASNTVATNREAQANADAIPGPTAVPVAGIQDISNYLLWVRDYKARTAGR